MTLLDASPLAPAADAVAASIQSIYHQLDGRSDLRPGPEVNELFSDLVDLVVTAPEELAAGVLADPGIRNLKARLRELCAHGETELERAWAGRIAHGRHPASEFSRFPYLDNYRVLTRMETAALIARADRPITSVAFVGSGPLPVSSLLLAQELRATVTNVDRDPAALAVSRDVADALGRHDLAFQLADAVEADLRGHDVVVVAALVGATPAEKTAMLRALRTRMDRRCLLLIRSARGLRSLLYPEVDLESMRGFDVQDVIHPDDDVINSVIVARPHAAATCVHPGPVPAQRATVV